MRFTANDGQNAAPFVPEPLNQITDININTGNDNGY